MKLFYSVVLMVFALPRLGVAQGTPEPEKPQVQTTEPALPSGESDWLPTHILSAPVHALEAPFHTLGKLIKRAPAKPTARAPAPAKEAPSRGLIVFVQAQGQHSVVGLVTTVDADLGYRFTPRFAADVGMPFFFVRGPYSEVTNHDWRYFTLWANPYLDARYTTKRGGTNITSILTATPPLSSYRVFSTGRAGVDWFNHLERNVEGLVTPFLNVGAANQTVNRYIMPRPYSLARPYYSLGFISDAELGASYRIRRKHEIGASAYAYVPAGPQKLYSRLIAPDSPVVGDGTHGRTFTLGYENKGPSRIARDEGYSAWIELGHTQHASLQLSYTRSIRYHLDEASLMLHFDISPLFRAPKPKE